MGRYRVELKGLDTSIIPDPAGECETLRDAKEKMAAHLVEQISALSRLLELVATGSLPDLCPESTERFDRVIRGIDTSIPHPPAPGHRRIMTVDEAAAACVRNSLSVLAEKDGAISIWLPLGPGSYQQLHGPGSEQVDLLVKYWDLCRKESDRSA